MGRNLFYNIGGKLQTGYAPTAEGAVELIDDYYELSRNAFANSAMAKSAGMLGYNSDNGHFNPVYGADMTAAMFCCDNAFTAIGTIAYDHEGVRIIPELASYGLDPISNEFVGIGAGTVQDGLVPESVAMPIGEFRQPFKDLPFSFDYGMSLPILENKEDDMIRYKDYVEKMAVNFSDLMDKTILRPMHKRQPMVGDIETSLNSIARCIGSSVEVGTQERGVDITAEMVSPYGGMTSGKGDFYSYRGNGESNLDGQLVDAKNQALSLGHFRELYRDCAVNWANSGSPNNKLWIMGNIAQDKLSAQMIAHNILLDTVYVQKDFNGVRTVPGRDAGMVLNSFNNIPILQDGNICFNYATKKVSKVETGDAYLLDLDHIKFRILSPLENYSIDNPAITRRLVESNVLLLRGETYIDSFIQQGRIINFADDA